MGTTEIRTTFMAFTDTQRRILFRACECSAAWIRMQGGAAADRDAQEIEELGREVLGYLDPNGND